jgi:hypothetical protein
VFEFFRVWLTVLCAGFALGGVAIALLAGTRALAFMDGAMESVSPRATRDQGSQQVLTWMAAVSGAVMGGWGLTLTLLVVNAYGSRDAWVWWSIAGGLTLWYLLDTARSIYARIYTNAVLNTVLLVAAAIPLLATFGEFH